MGTISYGEFKSVSRKKWVGSNGKSAYWEAATIPVDLPTDTMVTLGRIVTGILSAGDLLDIEAWARITNDVGYTVGVGWHMKGYEYTLPGVVNPYFSIEGPNGQNVTKNGWMHHMPLHWSGLWEVPACWDGKRLVLCFRADAHSTAWQAGDTLAIDQGYGRFTVNHLKPVA